MPTGRTSQDHIEHRKARRSFRQRKIYAHLQDAIQDVDGNFGKRAYVWGFNEDQCSTRKIEGHAGQAAVLYVSEAIGEYDVYGRSHARFSSMDRKAGHGAHQISEGVINVEVQIEPRQGMVQCLDVPVQVKNGHMLLPGLMYHHGTPYVISQSAIDEIVNAVTYDQTVKTDRRHMYSLPKNAGTKTCATCGRQADSEADAETDAKTDVETECAECSKPDLSTWKPDFNRQQKSPRGPALIAPFPQPAPRNIPNQMSDPAVGVSRRTRAQVWDMTEMDDDVAPTVDLGWDVEPEEESTQVLPPSTNPGVLTLQRTLDEVRRMMAWVNAEGAGPDAMDELTHLEDTLISTRRVPPNIKKRLQTTWQVLAELNLLYNGHGDDSTP